MNLLVCFDKHVNDKNVYRTYKCNIKNLCCKSGANNRYLSINTYKADDYIIC